MVLEAAVAVDDGGGGRSADWSALGTLWAEVKPGSGRAVERGMVAVGSVPLRIVVRAAPAGSSMRPRPGQRLREGTRIYPILAVTEADAEGRHLTCFAREEVAG